jgi:tRNA (cmo5U34)-methyltransferase
MHIEKTEDISRTPGEVWDFIADARNDPRWCHKVDSVDQIAGDGPGPGAKYRVLHRPRPRKPPSELTMEAVEYDPPRHLRWREEDEDAIFNVVYRLEATSTGTRLTQIDDIDWKISKLALPIARAMVNRDIARQLAALKQTLEGARFVRVSGGETHSVKRHLGVEADSYDVQIRRLIPHYDDMIATGVELLAALAPADGHILDLGAGTGALSSAVLEGLPDVRVTALDVDVDMLEVARTRLARFMDRVAFQEGSFLDPLPAADAVVASLALHHVHDLGDKTSLYRAVHDALSVGGVLLNLDAAVTDGVQLNRLVFDRMAARMADHGISNAEARRHFAAWGEEDRYFPLDAELNAMREAGFDEVECFWRRGLCAITCGLRVS